MGDVNRLKVGEWVMAIGSPFGLKNTVTAGIVSAKQRDTGDYLPFIQTDVAVNPGNSGGPLINMRGEVVGINSQIYSRSGGFMGISFAIPIDEAIRVSDQLRSSGRVSRGRIGVQIDAVSKDVAEAIGLGKPVGALVRAVEPASPADKAGVEAGDIITKVDGKPIDKHSDLPRLIGAMKPGTKISLTVFRRGASRDLALMVAEIEPDKVAQKTPEREEKPKQSSVGHPSEASLAADSREGRDLFRAAVDSLWGCVICPWDYASSYNPSGPAYPIAAQHGTRANILMADGGVRLYRPGPVRMPSGSDVNSQFRSGPKATGNYWWDSDELPRSRRDGLYTD